MFENWLIIAFVAPALWSIVNLIDVYFVSDVYRDEYDGALISGIFPLILWGSVPLGIVTFRLPESFALLLLSGAFFLFANFFYFKSLFRENDAALIQILWSLTIPFTILFSFVFLGDGLFGSQYFGIVLILFGVVQILLAERTEKWDVRGAAKSMLPSSAFLAGSFVLSEQAFRTSRDDFFSSYLVFALGMALGAIFVGFLGQRSFSDRFSQVTRLTKKYFFVFFLAELLALLGTIASQRAVDLSPSASLVATIESLSPVFIMCFSLLAVVFSSLFLGKFKRALYKDQITGAVTKIMAVITVAVGIYLVK